MRTVFGSSNDGRFWSRNKNRSCSRKEERKLQDNVDDNAFMEPPGVLRWYLQKKMLTHDIIEILLNIPE